MFPVVPVLFAFVGALIISRQPRNVIGLLMMLPGIAMTFVVDAYLKPYIIGEIPPPAVPSLFFLLILWFSNWNWLLLVLPDHVHHDPVPNRPAAYPTLALANVSWNRHHGVFYYDDYFRRGDWRRVQIARIWQVPNPIGFLKIEWIDSIVAPFLIIFPVWIILCAASLFVRFRRAQGG